MEILNSETGVVTLVGTIHKDLKGPRRLLTILEHLNPEKVSLELPPSVELSEHRKKRSQALENLIRDLRKTSIPESLQTYAAISSAVNGYEVTVSVDFCESRHVPYVFADAERPLLNPSSDQIIAYLEEVSRLYSERFNSMTGEELVVYQTSSIDSGYHSVDAMSKFIRDEFDILILQKKYGLMLEAPPKEESVERERILTQRVVSSGSDLHIGGLGHMYKEFARIGFDDIPLVSRLGPYVRARMKLIEADVL